MGNYETGLLEEVRCLRDKVSLLEEENIQLKQLLFKGEWKPPVVLGLTTKESEILATIYKHKSPMSKERIFNIVYFTAHGDKIPDIQIIEVYICKMRHKLKLFNLSIINTPRVGYSLSQEYREILDKLLEEEK